MLSKKCTLLCNLRAWMKHNRWPPLATTLRYVYEANITGLSTALEVQRAVPSVKVTIFSDLVSPHTTADGAAGIFGLYLMGSTPVCDQVRRLGPPDHLTTTCRPPVTTPAWL